MKIFTPITPRLRNAHINFGSALIDAWVKRVLSDENRDRTRHFGFGARC